MRPGEPRADKASLEVTWGRGRGHAPRADAAGPEVTWERGHAPLESAADLSRALAAGVAVPQRAAAWLSVRSGSSRGCARAETQPRALATCSAGVCKRRRPSRQVTFSQGRGFPKTEKVSVSPSPPGLRQGRGLSRPVPSVAASSPRSRPYAFSAARRGEMVRVRCAP